MSAAASLFLRLAAFVLFFLFLSAPTASAQRVRAVSPPQAEATPQGPVRPKGSITGRVVDEEGQPVMGARVSAEAWRSDGGTGGIAVTDSEGKFSLEDLERGAYTVYAHAPAHFDASYLEYERGERSFHQPGDTVSLTLLRGGVVTGRVTDAKGEPVMGTRVNLVRVRTPDGRAVREVNRFMSSLERVTDDRGVFRSYGLVPGVYVVSAGGRFSSANYGSTPHGDEAPTFHPSATRDNATEITVRAGEESAGVDIRLRHEEGRTVGGTVEGVADAAHADYVTSVRLITASNTEYQGQAYFYGKTTTGEGFAFEALTDGEYDLVAERRLINGGTLVAGAARRVSVRGEDVKNLRITLLPLASLGGRVVLEGPAAGVVAPPATNNFAACREKPDALLDSAILIVRRAQQQQAGAQTADAALTAAVISREPSTLEAAPDAKGEFVFRGLRGGLYRLDARLGESFYVRSVKRPTPSPSPVANARAQQTTTGGGGEAFRLRAGENISGVVVTAVYGAATLRGRVGESAEGRQPQPPQTNASRVYLVPQERERAEDPLRHAEASVNSDGAFEFAGVAPGRYWLLARPAPNNDEAPPPFTREDERARLRREAEAAANSITFSPCQRVEGYALRPAPPKD